MRLAAIMAGGSGERFWPLSRKERPKQLLRLTDPDRTMLHEAVERIEPLVGAGHVLVATAPHLQGPIREAGLVAPGDVLAEPDRRNTLGALVWLAASLAARHSEAGGDGWSEPVTLAILTADHKIDDPQTFRKDVDLALRVAEATGGVVTLGIPPDRPETGYGYIESAPQTDEIKRAFPGETVFPVASFREKPSLATAEGFLRLGTFTWNSGMFFYTLRGFMDELEAAHPESHAIAHEIADALKAGDDAEAEAAFRRLPNLSIDYALMEKAKRVYVIPASFPWDDVGAFDSLRRTMPSDARGNVILGEVQAVDCEGCILYNEAGEHILTAVGLKEMILVQTHDAVMVAPMTDAQRVKEIVGRLKETSFV